MSDQDDGLFKGHFRKYRDFNFRDASLKKIYKVNGIIEDYANDGFDMTVRQIYYQLVQENFIPNEANEYDKLSDLVSNGRLAGLISWTAIVDRGRSLRGHRHFLSPQEAVKSAEINYLLDKWADQEFYCEVWVEKQAQEGTVGAICSRLDVNYYAVKGYNSQTEAWNAGQRLARRIKEGKRVIIFYLGDHDPSGTHMTEDVRERLSLFAGTEIMVQRLALNMNQIEELNLPPNPAKETDKRKAEYVRQYGTHSSWELDALNPRYIQELIEDAIMRVRDEQAWDDALKIEVGDREMLQQAIESMGGYSGEVHDDL